MSDEPLTPNRKALRALEFFIVLGLSLIMLWSIVAAFIEDQVARKRWLEQYDIILGPIAILECCLLLIWMCLGGQNSKLWNWFPPFCLFPKVLSVRWAVIILMILGTLIGVISSK